MKKCLFENFNERFFAFRFNAFRNEYARKIFASIGAWRIPVFSFAIFSVSHRYLYCSWRSILTCVLGRIIRIKTHLQVQFVVVHPPLVNAKLFLWAHHFHLMESLLAACSCCLWLLLVSDGSERGEWSRWGWVKRSTYRQSLLQNPSADILQLNKPGSVGCGGGLFTSDEVCRAEKSSPLMIFKFKRVLGLISLWAE